MPDEPVVADFGEPVVLDVGDRPVGCLTSRRSDALSDEAAAADV
jgi:hypothetical protein